MANFDDVKLAVEALTGGKNTVIMDDMGMPSIMVVWPKQNNKDLIVGGSDRTHYGSIVNDVEKTMYISKYVNIIVNDRAYSLPFQDPANSMDFDRAVSVCRNKGKGWGLMPYSLWSEVALWSRKNGTMPRGNNNFGQDYAYPLEKGVPIPGVLDQGRVARTATGTGPATWNHNWLPDGISDMNGNVSEWVAGYRSNNGELQIIPNANCMDPEVSLGANSAAWKAILADGSLVDPGTAGTLKYDVVSSQIQLCTDIKTLDITKDVGNWLPYTSMTLASGVTAPEIAKALMIYPDEPGGDYGGDYHGINVNGERVASINGYWGYTSGGGVFYAGLDNRRSVTYGGLGFRSAYCDL
ncbi:MULTISPECIES: SUMF1/EgtB/PvdO family nonheme iron enzyme [unclassified Bilifractor]|uniref:SUMF1/EgtB/PvdO family nonheme iron enzyme n=1 Tax=unclassified Bilifractor TaxID=2815795 RepID=UPI003F90BAC3